MDVVPALVRRILPKLADGRPFDGGVREWLEQAKFQVVSDRGLQGIVIGDVSAPDVVPFISFDFLRFSFSGLESLAFCKTQATRPKAIAWPLLHVYYAAFFSAHSIMRATGSGVVRIETPLAKRVSEIAGLYGINVNFGSGSYVYKVKRNSNQRFDISLERSADTGGAHDQFWREFHAYLDDVGRAVAEADEPDAEKIVAEISEIQELLSGNSSLKGTWLSVIRNKINYQHDYNVWFPYGAPAKAISAVSDISLDPVFRVRLDHDHSKNPLQAFVSSCRLLTYLNYRICAAIRARSTHKHYRDLWAKLESENAFPAR